MMIPYRGIKKIFVENNGIARTADIIAQGFHNRHIDIFIDEEKIIRIKRGVYQWIEEGRLLQGQH
ncbi:MAG: Transcriptional regulator, AbiEi antitoxin [Petroclostridium sp.]|nr:Transcriptional regulator, AbiEi antitoxin [Thermoanaerobacter sp.]MDK2811387.1 Transcriptional regulator, AbiEi antitoxin [Petroclostridium sp.]